MAPKSPERGCAQCYRGQAGTPVGHAGGPPWSPESFLRPGAGHEGHLHGAKGAGTWPKWPKGSLARGHAQCCRGGKKPPGRLANPPRGEKSLRPPQLQGMRGCLRGARAAGSNPAKVEQRSPARTSGHAQCCRGRRKTPGDQCQCAPGENSFLTPALAIGCSLSMGARLASSCHWLVKPSRRCPGPLLPQPGAISGDSESGQMPPA